MLSLLIVGCTEPILPKEKKTMTTPTVEVQKKNSQSADDPVTTQMGDLSSIDTDLTNADFSNFENDLGSLQW